MSTNITNYPRRTTKRLRIINFFKGLNAAADESVLSPEVSPDTYNFDFSSGALRDAYGIAQIASMPGMKSMWVYRRLNKQTGLRGEILMGAYSDGTVRYMTGTGAMVALEGISLSGTVRGINYRLADDDVILICSDCDRMVVWDGESAAYTVPSSPFIKSMTMHYERMFVVDADGETLRFSDDLDPTNWSESLTEGGYIRLADDRGRLNKVISFLNYLYILRDYGISRLTAYGDQTEYSLTSLFVSSGRIYAQTAALCGDRVIFLAEDGLYVFDGLNTRKILSNLKGQILPDENAEGAYYNGRYYLSCRLKDSRGVGCESSDYTNNGLIVYEPSSGIYCFCRGLDVGSFAVYRDKLTALCYTTGRETPVLCEFTNDSVYLGAPLEKKWTSPFTDLGSERQKILKELHITTSGPLDVSVKSDMGTRAFSLSGDETPSRTVLNLRGTRFSVSFTSRAAGALVTRPYLLISEL